MTSTTAQAFADAASRMVSRSDIAGDLVLLLVDCADLLSAEAVGLLVAVPDNGLELLSSSAHRAPGHRTLRTPKRIWAVHRRNPPPANTSPQSARGWTLPGPRLGTDCRPRVPLRARVPADVARQRDRALNVFHADPVVLDDRDRHPRRYLRRSATAVLARPSILASPRCVSRSWRPRRTYRDRAGQRRHRLPGEPGDE